MALGSTFAETFSAKSFSLAAFSFARHVEQ